jgi:hypothetical protein
MIRDVLLLVKNKCIHRSTIKYGFRVPGPSRLEAEIGIAKLEKYSYKSPGSDQIQAELIQARGAIKSLILFGVRKNYLISGRSQLLYQFTKRVIKLTVIIIV